MSILLAVWLILSDQTVWQSPEPVDGAVVAVVDHPVEPFLQEHPHMVGRAVSALLYHNRSPLPATWKGVALSQGATVTFSHMAYNTVYLQLSTGKLYRIDNCTREPFAIGTPLIDIFSTAGYSLLQRDTDRWENAQCLGRSQEPLVLDVITDITPTTLMLKNKGEVSVAHNLRFIASSWQVDEEVLVIDRYLPFPLRRGGGFTDTKSTLQRLIFSTNPQKPLVLTSW